MRWNLIPPISPFGLIQEALWPNEWKILVVCIFLNQTSRKQVEKVWDSFVKLCPGPRELLLTPRESVAEIIKPLGFKDRRTKLLYAMTEVYLAANWEHAHDLPGIGEYGARSWEIFVKGVSGDTEPKDHALTVYWKWVKSQIASGEMRPW